MNKCHAVHLLLFICMVAAGPAFAIQNHHETDKQIVEWESLPELPDTTGLAGIFTGVHNDVLIVAGGANFPGAMPWEGGNKVYHDQIYILEKNGREHEWIIDPYNRLPRPLGYGVTYETNDGLIIAGGTDGQSVFEDVYLVEFDPESRTVIIDTLPSLPVPLAFSTGAVINNQLLLAGGQTSKTDPDATDYFFSLDLNDIGENGFQWEERPSWPGSERILAVSSVQSDGLKNLFYLFGGRNVKSDGTVNILNDGYTFDPGEGTWNVIDSVESEQQAKVPFMGSSALPHGEAHLLFFGGDPGVALEQRVLLSNKINRLADSLDSGASETVRNELFKEKSDLRERLTNKLESEISFNKKVYAYHTITDSWSTVGIIPGKPPVTTRAVYWDGSIILPSGEIRPGVRTNRVLKGEILPDTVSFGFINYSVLAIYMILLVGMGYYFSRRKNETDEFFLAGQRIPWWAAGLSIYATQLSAITFIAIPAVAFATNWLVYPAYITIFLMVPIVITFYLPFFRRLHVTTAYEYLEKRFNLAVRLFGSFSFIIFQLGRMSVLVFLPALVITAIIGMDIYVAIILMGILSIIYTVLGGMEAVVWTDVIQVFILVFGIIYSLVFILIEVGGVETVYQIAMSDEKFLMFDWSLSMTDLVTWSIFLGTFALQFGPYTTDQAVIQRYLTTKNEKEAAKSLWTNGIISIPTGLLFFSLGTALYVFYKMSPELISVGMQNDQIFPLFIGQQLPVGLSGLVIAGIFAASMSSLDSSMHSISTAWTVDFHKRFHPESDQKKQLRLAKFIVVIVGIFGTAMACILALFPIQSLYFLFQEIIGLLGSALAGIFILGIFSRKATSRGVLAGAITSLVVMGFVKFATGIHFYIYPLIGIPVCILIGYFFSLADPDKNGNLAGLTYKTLTHYSD